MFEKTLFGQIFKLLGAYPDHRRALVKESYGIDKEKKFKGTEQQIIWINVVSIFLLHLAVVYSIFSYCSQISLPLYLYTFLIVIISGLGITAGVHRLWSHKSYKAKLPLRLFLLLCYTVAGQNSLYDWVRDHRVHHKYSETDGDPHNVNRGFFFAHVGWLMMRKHPEVIAKGRAVDMSDIENDPLIIFHTKYFIPLKILFSFVIPTAIPVFLWGESWKLSFIAICVLRYSLTLNTTWLVNSAAHTFGNRPFDKNIKPTENAIVAALTFGEGWHNYHHVFPWDYKTSELGPYTKNFTTMFIDLMALLGQAYDLKQPSQELIIETAKKRGDGTATLIGEEVAG